MLQGYCPNQILCVHEFRPARVAYPTAALRKEISQQQAVQRKILNMAIKNNTRDRLCKLVKFKIRLRQLEYPKARRVKFYTQSKIHTCLHTYASAYTCMHIHTHACTHARTHAQMQVHKDKHLIHAYRCIHNRTYFYIHRLADKDPKVVTEVLSTH